MKNYDDIIDLPHPTSMKHPRMSAEARAAQFSPFAALTGYDEAVKETARLTDWKIELGDYQTEKLSKRTDIIIDMLNDEPEVTIEYFVPDEKKDGGAYVSVTVNIKDVDLVNRLFITTDKQKIPMDDVLSIESEVFNENGE